MFVSKCSPNWSFPFGFPRASPLTSTSASENLLLKPETRSHFATTYQERRIALPTKCSLIEHRMDSTGFSLIPIIAQSNPSFGSNGPPAKCFHA